MGDEFPWVSLNLSSLVNVIFLSKNESHPRGVHPSLKESLYKLNIHLIGQVSTVRLRLRIFLLLSVGSNCGVSAHECAFFKLLYNLLN